MHGASRIALVLPLLGLPAAFAAPPSLSLPRPTVDPCGMLRGAVVTEPRDRDRAYVVTIGQVEQRIVVPAGQTSAPYARFVGGTQGGLVEARRWGSGSASVSYLVGPLVQTMRIQPPIDPPLGEIPPLVIGLDGTCDPRELTLAVDGARPAGPPDGLHTAIPLALDVGTHTLSAVLSTHGIELDRQLFEVRITPPCEDNDADGFLSCRAGDCDDRDPNVHPGATDRADDGKDQDCDGVDGRDGDGDGYASVASGGTDCDDADRLVSPAALGLPDRDGDGVPSARALDFDCDGHLDHPPERVDCDDADPSVPRAEDATPNGRDDDCDGLVDEGTVAYDDDADGQTELAGDCDDADRAVHGGALERANCRDDDCDGAIDEGITRSRADDRFEPNDEAYAKLPGATALSGLFGGYRTSDAQVVTITRDGGDVERFEVFAHDGPLDQFHVTVRVDELGDTLAYVVRIHGPGGVVEQVVRARGDAAVVGGRGLSEDTGTYQIEVSPVALPEGLDHCPLVLDVSTG